MPHNVSPALGGGIKHAKYVCCKAGTAIRTKIVGFSASLYAQRENGNGKSLKGKMGTQEKSIEREVGTYDQRYKIKQ